MGLLDFWKKLVKAYKDSQIWNKIETSEDLKQAYKDSYEKPVALLTCATMHFRSDYMMGDTGNSNLKQELSEDLGVMIEAATFLLFRDGQVIFKRHEELVDMERLMKKLFEE